MKSYDYIVVGSGLAGGVIARQIAEKMNKTVCIFERRSHIAGNIFDYTDEKGIKVQKYGPHVIHTNSYKVYEFITRFCKPIPYRTKCEAVINGVSTPSPFNFTTIDQFYSVDEAMELKKRLKKYYNKPSVTIVEMLECKDSKIHGFAKFLYDNDYKLYTAKQWDVSPSDIDPSVLKRVPIVLSYDDAYFCDKYEFIPWDGFTKMFRSIIDHPNINIELNTDALNSITFNEEKGKILYKGIENKVIYTGAIDELFGYKYGFLPYRSLVFKYKHIRSDSYQNTAIVAYPQADGFTRVTEYIKMPFQDGHGWTSVVYEYPVKYNRDTVTGGEPYYPVNTEESQKIYLKYREYAEKYSNLILCGRLAEFKYYNMDQVILQALDVYRNLEADSD